MMHIQTKNTLRTMLVISVASGLMLSACGFNKESRQQQPKMDTGNLHAPRNNPSFDGNVMTMPQDGMRAPAGNPNAAPQDEMMQADARMQAQQPMQAAPQQKKGGMFDWAWARKPEQPQVNTMERRVPKLNQDPAVGADSMAMASYEAAAPVGNVEMSGNAGLSPQSDIVVADEVIMMDDTFTPVMPQKQVAGAYPNLGDVPPRPERIDAINQADARMADLEQARAETYAQTQSMEAQYAADAEGSLLPQAQPQTDVAIAPQNDIDAEFAALVSADGGAGSVPVVIEEQPAVVVSGGTGMYDQAPAPIAMANSAPQGDSGWQPAPLTPQTQPVQENQWVSLEQPSAEAQMAVPVEQVDVSSPQVAAVSPVPVMGGNNAVGGIELTPPSSFGPSVRTLPESRYAARREAVYMQRYSRMRGGY